MRLPCYEKQTLPASRVSQSSAPPACFASPSFFKLEHGRSINLDSASLSRKSLTPLTQEPCTPAHLSFKLYTNVLKAAFRDDRTAQLMHIRSSAYLTCVNATPKIKVDCSSDGPFCTQDNTAFTIGGLYRQPFRFFLGYRSLESLNGVVSIASHPLLPIDHARLLPASPSFNLKSFRITSCCLSCSILKVDFDRKRHQLVYLQSMPSEVSKPRQPLVGPQS